MIKRAFFVFLLLCICLASALALVEAVLRSKGTWPLDDWVAGLKERREYPVVHDPDSLLGWRSRPGVYEWEAVRDGKRRPLRATIFDDGRRATANHLPDSDRTLVFVGGSFTHGWTLSDEETFPWTVQESHPSLRVLNYGTGAYSTYQSYLALKHHVSDTSPPQFVLYGMIGHHSHRNVAAGEWRLGLMSQKMGLPYCTIDERADLVCRSPKRFSRWPLSGRLAVVSFAEARYAAFESSERESQGWLVTQELVAEMARLSRSWNARFGVVFFEKDTPWKTRFTTFLAENDIDFIDCGNSGHRDTIGNIWAGHPSAQENLAYANCISAVLENRYGVDRRGSE